MTSFSNLRARNYNIESSDRNLVKFISGKIIPAISTTSASICGYILSQIYTLIRNNYSREDLREINFTLSIPYFCINKPRKPIMISNKKDEETKLETKVPYDFTVWDKIEIEGSLTTNQLIDILVKKIGFEFIFDGLYTINDVPLIEKEDDMKKLIEDLYFGKIPIECENNILLKQMSISKKDDYKNIYLKFFGEINESVSILFPLIRYHYKYN